MSNAGVTTTRNFDHLLYLRIFEGCNLHCEHCFIPSNPKRMTLEDIQNVPTILADKIPKGSKIMVQWHGGEPTLLGPEFMRQAIETLKADSNYEWSFGLQTNLSTYSQEWADIYHDYFEQEVGVSWDEKIRMMKSGDVNTRNQRFEEMFWPNIAKLIDDGLSPYLVVTGTHILFETYKNPTDWFELMTSRGIHTAHIERLTKTGYARSSWDKIGMTNAEYSKYMSRWYRAYVLWNAENPDKRIAMSPFDGLQKQVDELISGTASGGYGCWSGNCDTTFHTIDANGYKAGCTAVTSEFDNPRHQQGQPVLWFGKTPNGFEVARNLRKAPCEQCEFQTICSTGCLATEKMDDSMECSGASKLFETIKRVRS